MLKRAFSVFWALFLAFGLNIAAIAQDQDTSQSTQNEQTTSSQAGDSNSSMLEQEVLGNPVYDFLIIGIAILLGIAAYLVLLRLIQSSWFKKLAEDRPDLHESITELIKGPSKLILVTIVLAISIQVLSVSPGLESFVSKAVVAFIAFTIAFALMKFVDVLIAYLRPKIEKTESKLDDQLMPLFARAAKIFIIITAILFVLQNLGQDIGAILATLGLGGIAFALAAQKTLSNLISAVAILFDRPFQVGDMIEVGDVLGTIEEVGFWSTRVRTFEGSLVTFPNSQIADTDIDNFALRPSRRTTFTIGVTYETSYEKLQQAVKILREVMENHASTDTYRAFFNSYGDFSLNIFCQHFCLYLDYDAYLGALEEINFEIKRRFDEEGISFAFPTQTIHLVAEQSPE